MAYVQCLTGKDIFIMLKQHYFKFYDIVKIADQDIIKFKNGNFIIHITYKNGKFYHFYLLENINDLLHIIYSFYHFKWISHKELNDIFHKILPLNKRKQKLQKIILLN